MILALVLSLIACDEGPVTTLPVESEAPILASGTYELQVYGVSAISCEGADARDIVGESMYVDVRIQTDGRAVVGLDGWELRGDMAGANLYVEGSAATGDEPREPRDDEEPREGGGGADSDEGAPPPCDVEQGEEGREEGGESRPSDAPFASLDAIARNAHLADGRLSMSADGCSMDLEVVMIFVGEGRDREDRPESVDVEDDDVDVDEG